MNKTRTLAIFIISASFLIGFYLYPQMPDMMASHWNYKGEADGYMSKFWGLFLMPLMSAVLFLLFILIPRIDPLKNNVEKFRTYFDGFILIFEIFFLYLYLLTIFWNMGGRFDMTAALMPAMGMLFYYIGVMISKAKRNWFIGIRNPWTLSSDTVWDKTHELGGKLFKAAGIMTFLGALFPDYAIFLMLVPVVSVSLYLTVYSYLEFRKEKNGNNK